MDIYSIDIKPNKSVSWDTIELISLSLANKVQNWRNEKIWQR